VGTPSQSDPIFSMPINGEAGLSGVSPESVGRMIAAPINRNK
jgi:hypothetical protein